MYISDLFRDEEEQDDYEERIELKLAEQEEEELGRIKEESRKRRQAILEKYKSQQLQQQTESHPVDVNKGFFFNFYFSDLFFSLTYWAFT